MSEFESVSRGPLKLKTDALFKKKKKRKQEKKLLDQINKSLTTTEKEVEQPIEIKRTKAEIAFKKQQEQIQKKRILEKASMTHKQRVEEFNRHLDNLTEHFDIPKVSWTK